MKSAKKTIIIGLAFVIILSTLITTAFATGVDFNGATPGMVHNPSINFDNSAFTDFEASRQLSADASVGSGGTAASDTAFNGMVLITEQETANTAANNQTAVNEVQLPVKFSGIKSTLIDGNNIPTIVVGQEIANYALKFNGYKYVYGASSPAVGFDCSGLVNYVFSQFGYAIPRTAYYQYQEGTTVAKADLKPGDLLFFATAGGRYVSHVGIYIGNNQFISAATTNLGVIISNLDDEYWAQALVGAKELFGSSARQGLM